MGNIKAERFIATMSVDKKPNLSLNTIVLPGNTHTS